MLAFLQVTPLELTTKLMDAAKSNGAEVRIAAVTGVSSAPMDSPSSEEAGSGGGSGAGDNPGGRRITGVTLESGEEVACDRVGAVVCFARFPAVMALLLNFFGHVKKCIYNLMHELCCLLFISPR